MRNKYMFLGLIVYLASASVQNALAAEEEPWQFEVTPYLFAAGLDGEVGVQGVTADVDISFSEILDVYEGGFMGVFTAQKGPWSFGLEGIYSKIGDAGSNTVTGPFGTVSVNGALDLTSEFYIYQASLGYRLLDDNTELDLIGALRYTKIEADTQVKIATTPAIVFPGGSVQASGSESWTDAVIGVRAIHPLNVNLSLLGYADVGAGDSDLTYQWLLGANWDFKEKYTLKLGYRSLTWDYSEDGTVWDVTMEGLYLGLGFRF